MSRYGEYDTAVPRRRGGYGAYKDDDAGAPPPRRPAPRDDPYSSVRPLPPRVSSSSVYDTYRPPNLHGPSGGSSASSRRDDYSRRDEYRRDPPPSRSSASAYDTYRPVRSERREYDRAPRDFDRDGRGYERDHRGRDDYRGSSRDEHRGSSRDEHRGSSRDEHRGGGRDEFRGGRDPYNSSYPRRAPPENDYGAYATYRPPTKPSAEYERKLEKYAGVAPKHDSRRYRDDDAPRRRSSRRDDTDSEDESPVRRKSSKKNKKKSKKKSSRRRDEETDSDEETEDETESDSEESSSEEEVKRKKSKSKSKKSKKKSKSKKKKKHDTSSEEESSEEESESEDENQNKPLAIMPPPAATADPSALGLAAFGGTTDLMGGEVTETAVVPVTASAAEFANMPGEYPQDMTPKGSLAGRFPQIGSAVATPMGPGVMTGQGVMPGGMMGMGMGMQPQMQHPMGGSGMMNPAGMGFPQQGGMGMMNPGAMGMGMPQQGMGMLQGMGMPQQGMGMNGGQPDLLTQDFNNMNLGGAQ